MCGFDANTCLAARRSLLAAALAVAWVLVPSAAHAQSPDDEQNLRACDNYMGLYARSAARKLARALSGQGYRLDTLELPESVSANIDGQNVSYQILTEKDGRSAGVVDASRKARRSYVVTGTDQGPVMTSHLWPSRADVADGKECRPISSRIEFPNVAVKSVDVEPFKYWGLRVSWHLPEKFDANTTDSLEDFVSDVINESVDGEVVPSPNSGTSKSNESKDPDQTAESGQTEDIEN